MSLPRPELLAPAGSPAKLRTALHFGADAVYLGLKTGSLRAFARNFTLDELEWGLGYARERGRRVYVTLNVQAFDDDLPSVAAQLRALARLRPDGLIVADPGVLALAREHAPAVPIHLSTQASVTNAAAARFWAAQGVRRIVVARELSLERLATLVADAGSACELEAFVHGAVCVAYSGRCFLSLYWSGRQERDGRDGRAGDPGRGGGPGRGGRRLRDAGQGACAQACRWPYARMAVEDARRPGQWNPLEQDERGTHFFDAKDLCALPVLPRLLATGVAALKIEGRSRSAHYVGVTVDVYRHALDRLAAGDTDGFAAALPGYLEELHRPANRGFSTHFLTGEQDALGSYNPGGSYPDGRFGFLGVVEAREEDGLWVRCRNAIHPGDRLEIRAPGLSREVVALDRIETREAVDVELARHDDLIRLPGSWRAGPGALVRRAE